MSSVYTKEKIEATKRYLGGDIPLDEYGRLLDRYATPYTQIIMGIIAAERKHDAIEASPRFFKPILERIPKILF